MTALETWLNGESVVAMGPEAEAQIRAEFGHLATQHMRLLESLSTVHRDLLKHAEGIAGEWSPDAHLHGYLMGRSREAAVIGSLLGTMVNAAIVQGSANGETGT